MLKRSYRVRKNKEFKNVFSGKGLFRGRFFLLRFKKNGLQNSRFGFIVSTKVSKKAVDRNLVKRRLREVIRTSLDIVVDGYDIIFLVNKNILKEEYSEIYKETLFLLERSGLLKKD